MAPSAWDASSWLNRSSGGNYLRRRSRELRENQTPAEAELWTVLQRQRCGGWKFRRQVPIGTYIVDFFCVELGLAIEVDGSAHSTLRRQNLDRQRQDNLERKGVLFLRYTNSEVMRELGKVRADIMQAIATLTGAVR